MNIKDGTSKCALVLDNIVKVYGQGENKVNALKGVSLSFRKNEFVSILGPSGCGKTTLLNIIGGLDRYTSGDLKINGKSTKNYVDRDWDAYRSNSIGFVFQSYNLIPHQTVLANVELALKLSGISASEAKDRAMTMLNKVGLTEQANKKPNTLSGGQMQRVAIARALVNDPEIILADEPTGALDTETSIQIMDLLKEVAKDRLVIMVTHNPDLAERYSTRTIKLLDGEKVDDTNPVSDSGEYDEKKSRKPKMGFKIAFALSMKNLFSKKARTILTSIAGSIGIFGVALVLALSNGFNIYMARMQTDTLASYPLTISESSVDLSTFNELAADEFAEKYPEFNNVFVEASFHKLTGMLKTNIISDNSEDGFLTYLNKTDESLYYAISYDYGFDMNDYFYTDVNLNGTETFTSIDIIVNLIEKNFEAQLQAAMGLNTGFVRQYIPTIEEMPDRALINEQYDVLYGEIPQFDEENANKMVLVVDESNSISDISMMLLGYISGSFNAETNDFQFEKDENGNQIKEIPLEDILGKGFYLAKNEIMFGEYGGNYFTAPVEKDNDKLEKLEISGILRAKENTDGILRTGLAYSPALTEKVVNANKDSAIALKAKEDGKVTVANAFLSSTEDLTPRRLAGVDTPSEISIFAKDFESKEQIKAYLEKWNDKFDEGDAHIIAYSDMMSMMFGMLNTMVNAVTYVLIAFTSISLIVSSVMIGIITYTSVVERTKEIGVLRSLGASKNEISNVFNAETFIIGLFAGLIGVGFTYLVSLPLNVLLRSLIPDVGSLVILKITAALMLTAISILLTLIAGLVPARIAAKKDPVVALRSE